MRILEHTVTSLEAGKTLKAFVPAHFHLGTHAFRRLKVQSGILVNGEPRHVTYSLCTGDRISLILDDAEIPKLSNETDDSGLIVYLDDDLLIVNKPAPMATIPDSRHDTTSLRDLLARTLSYDPTLPFHPVNRLDKGTSGLLCIARHSHAQNLLTRQLHTDAFSRVYLAVTDGIPSPSEGKIDLPIAQEGDGVRRFVHPDGKPALTLYRVESICSSHALVHLQLMTGRTHQIRVHLSAIGCPIVGDYLYGQPSPLLPDRFALHSAELTCTQPITGKRLHFESSIPESFHSLLR